MLTQFGVSEAFRVAEFPNEGGLESLPTQLGKEMSVSLGRSKPELELDLETKLTMVRKARSIVGVLDRFR